MLIESRKSNYSDCFFFFVVVFLQNKNWLKSSLVDFAPYNYSKGQKRISIYGRHIS